MVFAESHTSLNMIFPAFYAPLYKNGRDHLTAGALHFGRVLKIGFAWFRRADAFKAKGGLGENIHQDGVTYKLLTLGMTSFCPPIGTTALAALLLLHPTF